MNFYNKMMLKSEQMFSLAEEVFERGHNVKIIVTGNSMYPFMRSRRDSVELKKRPFDEVKKSDIVLARRDDGAYILHRVVRKGSDFFYMIGDAQDYLDGPYRADQFIARVEKIFRDDRVIICDDSWLYRMFSRIWMCMRPIRVFIVRTYRRIRNGKTSAGESGNL